MNTRPGPKLHTEIIEPNTELKFCIGVRREGPGTEGRVWFKVIDTKSERMFLSGIKTGVTILRVDQVNTRTTLFTSQGFGDLQSPRPKKTGHGNLRRSTVLEVASLTLELQLTKFA